MGRVKIRRIREGRVGLSFGRWKCAVMDSAGGRALTMETLEVPRVSVGPLPAGSVEIATSV